MTKYLSMLVIIFICLIAAGAYFFISKPSVQTAAPTQEAQTLTITEDTQAAQGFLPAFNAPANNTSPTGDLAPPREPPQGYKEYRNTAYRFALFYPEHLVTKEYDEGNNAKTTTFEAADNSQSFEVFVVPYGERQVTQERFNIDEPSGVIGQPVDVMINGVRGTMFFGKNSIMGNTREVWFVHNGYLFEVATYKDLDAWLSQIMATWQFLE